MLSVQYDAIPPQLQALPQWVVWRLEERKGKPTKVPYDAKPGGKAGKSNDAATWADWPTAAARAQGGGFSGVGFVFSHGDGLTGVDLDHVIDLETGEINGSALPVLEAFAGTYIELSPSGTGIRIFCKGKPGRCGKNSGKYKWLEVYDHTSPRYLTVTGHGPFYGSAPDITDQQAALDWLYSTYFVEAEKPRTPFRLNPQQGADSPALPMGDQELIERAIQSKQGAAFSDLFGGNLDRHGGDHSSADLAFCSMLAWWTRKDAAQIDRIFRSSGLMREKWDKVHRPADSSTYGQMTIERAVASCVGEYEPRQRRQARGPASPAATTAAGRRGPEPSGAMPPAPPPDDGEDGRGGLPEIRLGGGRLVSAMQEAERVLFAGNEPPFFQRGGLLTWINRQDMVRDRQGERIVEHGVLQLAPVTTNWLRRRLMLACNFTSWSQKMNEGEGGWAPVNLPKDYAETYIDGGDYWAPKLRAVVEAPVMRDDGTLITKKGYDAKLGLYLDSDVKWKALPERKPGEKIDPRDDKAIQWAKDQFDDLFASFNPVTMEDWGVLVATVLTGLMKTQIGAAPGVVITAPVYGSGKGKIADIIHIIVTGKASSMMVMPADSRGRGIDEKALDNTLFAALLAGKRIICIDEVKQTLHSPTLDNMLTASEAIERRVLGLSKNASVSTTDTLFIALGNNVSVAADSMRRWLRIFLDPQCQDPHKRTFDRDPVAFARKNRVQLVCAAYTILHGYIHAGMPDMGVRCGSFERWAALIASAVVWAGFGNPVATQEAWKPHDRDTNLLGALLEAWFARFDGDTEHSHGVTSGEVIRIIQGAPSDPDNANLIESLNEICGEKGGFNVRKLGNFLAGKAMRVVKGMRIENAGEKKGAILWRVVET